MLAFMVLFILYDTLAFLLLFTLFLPFFLKLYRDHRDLHSFPTRRSSDLGVRFTLSRRESTRRAGIGTLARLSPSNRYHRICRWSTCDWRGPGSKMTSLWKPPAFIQS